MFSSQQPLKLDSPSCFEANKFVKQ